MEKFEKIINYYCGEKLSWIHIYRSKLFIVIIIDNTNSIDRFRDDMCALVITKDGS